MLGITGAAGQRCGLQAAPASTSGRNSQHSIDSAVFGGPPSRLQRGHAPRPGIPPCRVTNERKEMMVPSVLQNAGLDDDDFIVVDPYNPPPHPEDGPLQRTVSAEFSDALMEDEVDPEAMNWWFTEPQEGWNTEKRRLRKAEVIPTDEVDVLRHSPDAAAGRRPVGDLRAGEQLRGTVVKHMLHHGLQVDVGADCDGLIAVPDFQAWQQLGDSAPGIGEQVGVTVFAVRDDPVYRFPLQLMPTDGELAAKVPRPERHTPPLDLRDFPATEYEALAERTGRRWKPQKVIVPLIRSGGVDRDLEKPPPPPPELTDEMLDEFDAIAAGWL